MATRKPQSIATHTIRYFDRRMGTYEWADVCLIVDTQALAQVVGTNAANNTTGKARSMKGAIRCTLIRKKESHTS